MIGGGSLASPERVLVYVSLARGGVELAIGAVVVVFVRLGLLLRFLRRGPVPIPRIGLELPLAGLS